MAADGYATADRRVFGDVAETYHRFRPGYPAAVYELLRDRCGLRPGIAAFEVGPGTGQATRELLAMDVDPLLAIEPDERLAAHITTDAGEDGRAEALRLQVSRFEDAMLPRASFDLGLAATSFHWLDQGPALTRVADALQPGGWWAMWWNMFGEQVGHDPFHEATKHLLDGPDSGPNLSAAERPFPLDADARRHDLLATGGFTDIGFELIRRVVPFDAEATVGLYRTFSPVANRPEAERERVLAGLARIVDEQFGGRVDRTVLTPVHTARRI